MTRIVYLVFGTGTPRGGHKMAIRHVEALIAMGFDAAAWIPANAPIPIWLDHGAQIQHGGAFRDDDVLVFPEDAINAMRQLGATPHRKVVFCQNPFYAASQGVGRLSAEEAGRFRDYMACGPSVAHWLARFIPHDMIEVVPAFADERIFIPRAKEFSVACSPAKRPLEFAAIQTMVPRLLGSRVPWRWAVMQNMSEAEVAATMGTASVFLSLNRFEGLPITTLEAMAAGCLVVGFTGQGGRDYATKSNGFWVEEDDVVGCAEALAGAMALVEGEKPVVAQMRLAASEAAARFSRASFLSALDGFWSRRVIKA